MSSETLQFKTELKQILDIIIHSLYSHKEIFLRELISNANDALDTLRFQSLTKPELLEGDSAWKIRLIPDEKAATLTVSDNGIGMSREAIIEDLGTIARSGTRAFLDSLKQADVKDRPELIGQFGVGFYSSFMVADKVTVVSRAAGDPRSQGVRWESDGQGAFTIEPVDKPSRGTDVMLHVRPEDREFLKEWKLRELVKHYSDFVEHPIVLDVVREEDGQKRVREEMLNSRKAIWLRPRAEISREDYNEFYKQLAHDYQDPAKVIHYVAEGAVEFRALLYIPAHKTFDLLWEDPRHLKGLQLYIRRVFILDDAEALVPLYLRFVKGVVDSPDLPLNVSREMLQQSPVLEKIRSNLVNKVLRTLADLKKDEPAAYASLYQELGSFLKEGVYQDRANREALADLLLFASTRTESGPLTSLQEYGERMPGEQQEIYYLIGENRELLAQAPYLEAFRAKGQEVLLLTEPLDEFVVQALIEYKGKRLKAVDKGEAPGAAVEAAKQQAFQPLLDYLKGKLEEVREVRLSGRLKESAVCLVAEEGAPGPHLERLLQRLGKAGELPAVKKVLELNPEHPAVAALQKRFAHDPADARLEDYARLLYDEAVIAEGSRVRDPAAFVRRINELLLQSASS